jgi:hypothetical protein
VNADSSVEIFNDYKISDLFNPLQHCYVYLNPNTRLDQVNTNTLVKRGNLTEAELVSGNSTANGTLPEFPPELPEEFCTTFGCDMRDIKEAQEEMQSVYQTVKSKIEHGEFVYGSGVDESAYNETTTYEGPFPFQTFKVDSEYRIELGELPKIIPFARVNGESYSFAEAITSAGVEVSKVAETFKSVENIVSKKGVPAKAPAQQPAEGLSSKEGPARAPAQQPAEGLSSKEVPAKVRQPAESLESDNKKESAARLLTPSWSLLAMLAASSLFLC